MPKCSQWPRRPGFNLRSSHTKDSKCDTIYYKVRFIGVVATEKGGFG